MNITAITRRDILDALRAENINWAGRLEEDEFLSRIWDLEAMPTHDYRFENAAGDIWQHRIHNPLDWPADWVYSDSRFDLMGCDDEKFLSFLAEMVHPVVRPDRQEADKLVQLFNDLLAPDGYEIVERSRISGRPIFAPRRKIAGSPLGVTSAKKLAQSFNAEYLGQQISRLEAAIPHDPDLAIGTAKELVETCCKTILEERGKPVGASRELPQLVKDTYKELKLTPDDIPDAAKAADVIKRLLSNLATVTQGLAELRNSYGTGHGKSGRAKGLSARHAKLAAGAATTLAVFLFETHQERGAGKT